MNHKHHIIPRHLGGTNEPENLVEVSVEEHARIHHSQWILGGRWQDEVAWRTLSGQITKDKARRLAVSYALKGKPSHRRGKKYHGHSEKMKAKYASGYKNPMEGVSIVFTEERKKHTSKKSKEWWARATTAEKESRSKKISEKLKNRKLIKPTI